MLLPPVPLLSEVQQFCKANGIDVDGVLPAAEELQLFYPSPDTTPSVPKLLSGIHSIECEDVFTVTVLCGSNLAAKQPFVKMKGFGYDFATTVSTSRNAQGHIEWNEGFQIRQLQPISKGTSWSFQICDEAVPASASAVHTMEMEPNTESTKWYLVEDEKKGKCGCVKLQVAIKKGNTLRLGEFRVGMRVKHQTRGLGYVCRGHE